MACQWEPPHINNMGDGFKTYTHFVHHAGRRISTPAHSAPLTDGQKQAFETLLDRGYKPLEYKGGREYGIDNQTFDAIVKSIR